MSHFTLAEILVYLFLLGKSYQVKHRPPQFTPVNNAALTSQADQTDNPVIRKEFDSKANNNLQKTVNPFSKAAQGTDGLHAILYP